MGRWGRAAARGVTLVELAVVLAILYFAPRLRSGGWAAGLGLVLAGASAYHDPACPLVQDHPRLKTTTPERAAESGLAPCRTCGPEVPAVEVVPG